MKIAAFSLPKGWQEWITLAIGLWLFASPFTLEVDDPGAAENFLLVGGLVIIFELITFYTLRVLGGMDQHRSWGVVARLVVRHVGVRGRC